jgi:hypothetical protein
MIKTSELENDDILDAKRIGAAAVRGGMPAEDAELFAQYYAFAVAYAERECARLRQRDVQVNYEAYESFWKRGFQVAMSASFERVVH